MRLFKGIFYNDISEFESDHLSHAVRSPHPQPRSPVSTSPPGLLHLPAMAGGHVESAAPRTPMPDLKRRLSGAYTSALAEALASVTERGLA